MSAERVRNYLMEHGVAYETNSHSPAYTTSEVAEAEHVPGANMAKVVMLHADDGLVMVVVPGDKKVDLEKAASALGVDAIRLAEEDEFSRMFADCEIGAEPPFGALYGIATVVDSSLDSNRITFNAGSHTESITMDVADYFALTNPQRADLIIG